MIPLLIPLIQYVVGPAVAAKLGGQEVSTDVGKGLLFSKTFQGILIAMLPFVLRKFGVDMDASGIASLANDILVVGGSLWAAYGRIKASKRIG